MASKPRSIPLDVLPGVLKSNSPLSATGRYVDMDHVRFVGNIAEKIGGNVRLSTTRFLGIARGMWSWNDLKSRSNVAIGTSRGLYSLQPDNKLKDITPSERVITLTGAFSSVAGSKVVTVNEDATKAVPLQGITFSDQDPTSTGILGDLTKGKLYVIAAAGDAFTFESPQAATETRNDFGTVTITFDLKPGIENPAQGTGYGVGYYGLGKYGTSRGEGDGTVDGDGNQVGGVGGLFNNLALLVEAYYWSLSSTGQILTANPFGGKLYTWDPVASPAQDRAIPVPTAPGAMRGHFSTPERFLICYGVSKNTGDHGQADPTNETMDPMLVAWPDQGTYDGWDPLPAANGTTAPTTRFRRLTEGKRIVGGASMGNNLSLIWTDTAVYQFQYTGSTFVYDSRLVGKECGLAGPYSFTITGGKAYWFGFDAFWTYAGGGAARIEGQDDVLAWILSRQKPYYDTKTLSFYVPQFNEVWWLFVPNEGLEPSYYAALNLGNGKWTIGTMRRTAHARFDGGWNHKPLLAGTDGWLYQHEVGKDDTDADGNAIPLPWHLRTAPMELDSGNADMSISGFMPDMARHEGTVEIEFLAQDRSPDPTYVDRETQSFEPGQGMVDLRMAGRVVAFEMRSDELGSDFRLGKPKAEVLQQGTRR